MYVAGTGLSELSLPHPRVCKKLDSWVFLSKRCVCCLSQRQTDRKRGSKGNRDWEWHSLFHSLNGHSTQNLARMKPGAKFPFWSPRWVAEPQALQLSPATFQGLHELDGSWMETKAAGSQTGSLTWDCSVAGSALTCCATVPVLQQKLSKRWAQYAGGWRF